MSNPRPDRSAEELARAAKLAATPIEFRMYFSECVECGLQHYCLRCGQPLSSLLLCFKDGARFSHAEIAEAERLAEYARGGAVERSEACGNCGIHRLVDEHGDVVQCPTCGDDEWNIYEPQGGI